jgi:hypothetical protein
MKVRVRSRSTRPAAPGQQRQAQARDCSQRAMRTCSPHGVLLGLREYVALGTIIWLHGRAAARQEDNGGLVGPLDSTRAPESVQDSCMMVAGPHCCNIHHKSERRQDTRLHEPGNPPRQQSGGGCTGAAPLGGTRRPPHAEPPRCSGQQRHQRGLAVP